MERGLNKKYLRAPFLDVDVAFGQEIKPHISPNKAFNLLVTHRLAYAHKKYVYLFNLENVKGDIIENFEPLVTTGKVV